MAIHIRPTKQALKKEIGRMRRREWIAASCAVAVLLVAGILLLRHFVIVYVSDTPSFTAYIPPADGDEAPVARPQLKDLSARESSSPSAPAVDIIISTAPSSFSLDSVAWNPVDASWEGGGSFGFGIGGGSIGDGFGNGGGGNGGFGSSEAGVSSLKGTLYDLKKTRSGAASPYASSTSNLEVVELLGQFYSRGWNKNLLGKFRSSPTNLYASCFYVPNCYDSEAPYAYQCSETMEPSRWVAVYQGQVQAPKSGRFRFLGIGDSVMAVRFDRKNVLQCGFHTLDGKKVSWNTHRYDLFTQGRDVIAYPGNEYWNDLFSWVSDRMGVYRPKEMMATYKGKAPSVPTEIVDVEVPIYEDSGPLDPGSRKKGRKVIGKKKGKMSVPHPDYSKMHPFSYDVHMLDSFYALRHALTKPNLLMGGLEPGKVFTVEAGKWYDFELMVSEIGGGDFGFCLFIEDLDDPEKATDEEGRPLYQIFRTGIVAPEAARFYQEIHEPVDEEAQVFPPYDPDSLIWQARH